MSDDSSFLRNVFDKRLDAHVDERARCWAHAFSTRDDGSVDKALAYRIDREVHRRGAIGKQLDIYEPLRWTGISFLLSAALGIGIKMSTEKEFARPALWTLLITTALTSSIQLVRLLPRYDAGLRGGVDTALSMHEFDNNNKMPASWTQRVTPPAHTDTSHQFDI